MSLQIFISRSLDPDSPLKKVEISHEAKIIAESLIKIQPIPLVKMPRADWFFFYSKNGVECFVKQWTEKWKSTVNPQHIRWAAYGEGTAEAMNGWGISCDFVGQGPPVQIMEQFLAHSKPSESVVFFRAFHSRNSLYHLISEKRKADHVAIYDNQLIEKKFPPCDVGIFTSSRNAIAFFQNNPEPRLASIAIGQPTTDTLLALNVPAEKVFTAAEHSETELYNTLLTILESMEPKNSRN